MKKVLILGAKGMLGYDLNEVFSSDKNYEVFGVDKDTLDITNSDAVGLYFDMVKPEIVINAAAYTAVDDCETNEALANAVNGGAVKIIAEACEKINAIIIHISTDYVFDGHAEGGYNENDSPAQIPINAYARSKLLGEKFLIDSKCNYYLVRTSWLFGKNGKNFVDTIINLGKSAKAPLKIVNDQRGKPTYTKDLAQGIKDLIESKKPFGVYHLTNEGDVTWYEFTKEIFELSEIKTEVIPVGSEEYKRPAKRPAYSILLNTKFAPLRPYTEALKDYLGSK